MYYTVVTNSILQGIVDAVETKKGQMLSLFTLSAVSELEEANSFLRAKFKGCCGL